MRWVLRADPFPCRELFFLVPGKLLITWDLLPSIPLIEIMSPLPMTLLTFLFLMALSTHIHSVKVLWLLQVIVLGENPFIIS